MTTPYTPTPPYEVERRVRYGERPGFRITELQIGPMQEIPWHSHNQALDTFYVMKGEIQLSLREPEEELHVRRGAIFAVPPCRPHRVTNGGDDSGTFLVIQDGEYDFVPQN
jgi:mannose-6-phosphate isomerase-like protein (cupin superfamily)